MDIESLKEAMGHIRKAQAIFARGPLEFYLQRLIAHSEALMSLAPIQVGEHAVIVRKVPCNGGWAGSHKTLAVGAVGRIVSVDWDGGFIFTFLPLRSWSKLHDGWREFPPRNTYCLRGRFLMPATDEDVQHWSSVEVEMESC